MNPPSRTKVVTVVNEDYEAELIAYNKYVDRQERARIEAKNLKKLQAEIKLPTGEIVLTEGIGWIRR